MKKLIGFSIGPVIGAFISFITVPLTTYFVNPEEFGKASMFTVVQSLFVTFIYLGVDQAYTKEYHYEKDKKYLFQNALFIPLFAAVILAFFIFIFQDKFSILLFDTPNYSYLSNLFSVMIIASVIERFILLSIRMEEKSIEYSLFSIAIKLSILILTLLMVYLGNRTFLTIVYSTIFGQIICDSILVIRYRYLFSITFDFFDRKLITKLLKFGFPIIIAASVNNLLNTSGRFFLRGYSTYTDLGMYNAALKLSAVLTIVQSAFTSFWVPTAYRWKKDNREMKHFSFISNALLLIMTLLFFGILILKKYLIQLLSSSYIDAQYVFGMLALIPILYTLSETTTLGIVFSGKSYYNLWVSVLSLIPNIFLCYMLIPHMGTRGAAIAVATSYIIFCFTRTYFSKKCGFSIPFKIQIVNTLIFFFIAFLNMYPLEYINLINLAFFVISLLTQSNTIKTMISIKNKPSEWNFN